MSALTVTSGGRVTLPKDVLEHLGVQPGEKIILTKLPSGRIEISPVPRSGHISDVFNLLKCTNSSSLSIKETSRMIDQAWAGKR